MMFRSISIVFVAFLDVVVCLLSASHSFGGIGVAAGNAAGESSLVEGASALITLPNRPTLSSAQRLDKNTVLLQGSVNLEDPSDYYQILRASDDEPWEVKSGAQIPYLDTAAYADHDYRYTVVVIGRRRVAGYNYSVLAASDPAEEMRVAYSSASVILYVSDSTGSADMVGSLKIGGFIPDSFVSSNNAAAPDSYDPPSPYNQGVMDGAAVGIRTEGFVKRGALLKYECKASYRNLPYGGVPNFGWGLWGHCWAAATGGNYPDEYMIEESGSYYFPDLDFSGLAETGFDGRSNPKWQMIPASGTRAIAVSVPPITGPNPPLGMPRPTIQIDSSTGISCTALTSGETILATSDGGGGDRHLISHKIQKNIPPNPSPNYPIPNFDDSEYYDALRGTLGVDVRYSRPVKVLVKPVKLEKPAKPHINVPERVFPSRPIRMPDIVKIKAALDTSFGAGANVWFEVFLDTSPFLFDVDKYDGSAVYGDPNGSVSLQNDFETSAFNALTGYDFYVLVFPESDSRDYIGFYVNEGGRSRWVPLRGGYGIPETKWVFMSERFPEDGVPHELGHCMGLKHAHERDNAIGAAYIPDQSETRMMGYGVPSGRLLIKAERDTIHTSLDSRGIPNQ